MSDLSARLSLPYLLPAQAQKHVTHNEALQQLDIAVQLALEEPAAELPPALPEAGQVWGLGPAPTGDWAGQPGKLAAFTGTGWIFITPQEGWLALDRASGRVLRRAGNGWSAPVLNDLDGLGIGTSHDTTNRLAVAAPATLLTHEGAGHQLKINKAASGDTASLLFQTGWSGRAEMGTAGTDDFAIKVTADGSTWTTALNFAGADGTVSGAAVQASATDVTPGRLARADYAFGPGNLLGTVSQSGGQPTGAVLESGTSANGGWLRLACGTQIAWHVMLFTDVTEFGAGTFANPYSSRAFDWSFPAGFIAPPGVTAQVDTGTASGAARRLVAIIGDVTTLLAGSVTVSRFSGDGSPTTPKVHMLAVGRWF